jgi:hypothetical protein
MMTRATDLSRGCDRLVSSMSWRFFSFKAMSSRHAPDHPATFKEAEYLKAIYLKF